MKKSAILFLIIFTFLLGACASEPPPEETIVVMPTAVPTTAAVTVPPETETVPTVPEPVLELTEEEQELLLKLGMAERGNSNCTQCIALVMRTVLNRVESDRFASNSIHSVIYAEGQFNPVADGTIDTAEPNQRCRDALEMVIYGWDESQGALFYEWCEGDSWHSQNLHFLFQHCDVRYYD